MAFPITAVNVSEAILNELEKITRGRKEELRLVQRARIILLAAEGLSNGQIMEQTGLSRATCSTWRTRFRRECVYLERVQTESPEELHKAVCEVLADKPRSGRPSVFTDEQTAWIIETACRPPADFGVEASRWTCRQLALKAVESKIADAITPRTVGRLLNKADLKPWLIRYWLHSRDKEDCPKEYEERKREICSAYLSAPENAAAGHRTVCVDEMTGIQALERKYSDKLPKPGMRAKQEFEYIRHGTTTLIGFFDVATGRILTPYMHKTRKDEDFVKAVRAVISEDPEAQWTFVVDGLNIHKSEALVRFVAESCAPEEDLGKKGVRGILRNMKTREKFLHDPRHRIRFIFLPRHCSWLNQIEIWFANLSRKLLKRGSYVSVHCLEASIRRFIRQYNDTARPYKWTYTGIPLIA